MYNAAFYHIYSVHKSVKILRASLAICKGGEMLRFTFLAIFSFHISFHIYRINILIGYTVFLTSEENRIVILLTTLPWCWGRSERVFGFYV